MPLFPNGFFGTTLHGSVADDLGVANDDAPITYRREFTNSPEARPILPQPPSLFASSQTDTLRGVHLLFEQATRPIFLSEEPAEAFPQHLVFTPSEDPLRAGVPARDGAILVGADDRGVASAINDLTPLRCSE
jgi:hypothetical protein